MTKAAEPRNSEYGAPRENVGQAGTLLQPRDDVIRSTYVDTGLGRVRRSVDEPTPLLLVPPRPWAYAGAQRNSMLGSGLVLGSSPDHNDSGESDGREEHFRASVITGADPVPVLQAAEHDLDTVSSLVSAFAVLDGATRDFRPGMQGRIPLPFNASLNQSAS